MLSGGKPSRRNWKIPASGPLNPKSRSKKRKPNTAMKKLALKIPLLLTLIIAANFASFSQTPDSPTVPKGQVVSFLIEQNKNARDLIEKQNTRISDLETEVAFERENAASLGKSYESAKSEISSLKTANEALARAVAINEQTVSILQTDNAKQRDKAKRAVRDKWKVILVAAGIFALKLAIP